MKSYSHLWEKLISNENLAEAIDKSSIGKRDRKDVEYVRSKIGLHIFRLRRMLNKEKVSLPKHKLVKINDGVKQKIRFIIKPNYRYEQILHHALIQIMSPIIMHGMYPYSCGSIPDRGIKKLRKYLERAIRVHPEKCKYCYKADIRHFFPSISHEHLKILMAEKIHDAKFLRLCFLIIDNYHDSVKIVTLTSEMAEKLNRTYKIAGIYKFYERGMQILFYYGLPLGYYTSQWWSNWILQKFDHYMKEVLGVWTYGRYLDDIVVLDESSEFLHNVHLKSNEWLKVNLDLDIKGNWQVFRFDYIEGVDKKGRPKHKGRAIDFIGYQFYSDKTILRKTLLLRATRKARKIAKKAWFSWYEASQMMSYYGWFKDTNTYECYKEYILACVNIKFLKKKISRHGRRKNSNVDIQESTGKSGGETIGS